MPKRQNKNNMSETAIGVLYTGTNHSALQRTAAAEVENHAVDCAWYHDWHACNCLLANFETTTEDNND